MYYITAYYIVLSTKWNIPLKQIFFKKKKKKKKETGIHPSSRLTAKCRLEQDKFSV